MLTIGIDIGGTNTDAVLIDEQKAIIAAVKTITTADITTGLSTALKDLFAQSKISPQNVEAIFLGTTHATNAILQRKDLYKVGLIRLCGHLPESLPPCYDWPRDLKDEIFIDYETIPGGYECHGGQITPLEVPIIRRAIHSLLEKGAESLAVIGVFSPLNHTQEIEVGDLISEICGPHFPFSLSHHVGGVGFIERENSVILNTALKKVMDSGFRHLEESCKRLHLNCPLFLTQNNGSIISLDKALQRPLVTISAGPTNSFIGASRLAKLSNALVIDVGGTSTDIGLIQNGFPRRSLSASYIGGVKLNFPMPDVISVALGGGSYIDLDHSPPRLCQASAGREILKKARCFGGEFATLTDLALCCGHVQINGATKDETIPYSIAHELLRTAIQQIEKEASLLSHKDQAQPILLVGGGAALFPKELLSERFLIPPDAAFANAYGAALAEISGVVDQIVSLAQRESTLAELQVKAISIAIEKGADPEDVKIVDIQIIPYHYVPNQMARVMVTASGKFIR